MFSGHSALLPSFESKSLRLRSMNVNHYTTTLGHFAKGRTLLLQKLTPNVGPLHSSDLAAVEKRMGAKQE
jgi:hypothetical protein